MPRKRYFRKISHPPMMRGYKPFGCRPASGDPIILLLEEYEALRLCDYENLSHDESALRMEVSRPTFSRMMDSARKKMAQAFCENRPIFIQGGKVELDRDWFRCEECDELFSGGNGESEKISCPNCASENVFYVNFGISWEEYQMAEKQYGGRGQGGYCVCPSCDTRKPHLAGRPCKEDKCPQCGRVMVREGSYHHQLHEEKKQREK